MIISASRRTDIPAFYSDWFLNRLKEGYVLVRNPFNYNQISKVNLNKEIVDFIVFWTKNPGVMIDKLDLLNGYNYYFQFTLNPYDQTIETNVPKKSDLIETFIRLANTIGKNKVIWRYDPILVTNQIDAAYHYQYFEFLAEKLNGYTNKVIISFINLYAKTKRNTKDLTIKLLDDNEKIEIAAKLTGIANKYGISIESCSSSLDFSPLGIKPGKCIDESLISDILGENLAIEKDKNQRSLCGCATSIDIGAYNSCAHNCLYCYSNYNHNTVQNNITLHNPSSPLLFGKVEKNDRIIERKMVSYRNNQMTLF